MNQKIKKKFYSIPIISTTYTNPRPNSVLKTTEYDFKSLMEYEVEYSSDELQSGAWKTGILYFFGFSIGAFFLVWIFGPYTGQDLMEKTLFGFWKWIFLACGIIVGLIGFFYLHGADKLDDKLLGIALYDRGFDFKYEPGKLKIVNEMDWDEFKSRLSESFVEEDLTEEESFTEACPNCKRMLDKSKLSEISIWRCPYCGHEK